MIDAHFDRISDHWPLKLTQLYQHAYHGRLTAWRLEDHLLAILQYPCSIELLKQRLKQQAFMSLAIQSTELPVKVEHWSVRHEFGGALVTGLDCLSTTDPPKPHTFKDVTIGKAKLELA